MKLITYLARGAKLKPIANRPAMRQADGYEGEILHEASYQHIMSTIIRYRREGCQTWSWLGIETDGACVWYYDIETDGDRSAINATALLKRGDLPGFSHGPGYEYMVEGLAPLPADSPSWLIPPKADEREDLAKWRNKLRRDGGAHAKTE